MPSSVSQLRDGAFRVEVDGAQQTFYVAGTASDRWVWWSGEAYRIQSRAGQRPAATTSTPGGDAGPAARSARATPDNPGTTSDKVGASLRPALASTQEITAPMPAKVIRVMVKEGDAVRKGETLIVLEAMKMELPLRSAGDATVRAIRCQDGQLVQADSVLIELS